MTQMSKGSVQPLPVVSCCGNLEQLLEPRFFKALCEPSRIALLAQLAQCGRPCTVTELSRCCPQDFSVVSRHLSILKDARILAAEKRGKEVFYSVQFTNLAGTLRLIADAIDACCPPQTPDAGRTTDE